MTIAELTTNMERMRLMLDQASAAVSDSTSPYHHSQGGGGETLTKSLSHMEQLRKHHGNKKLVDIFQFVVKTGGGRKGKRTTTARKIRRRHRQANRRSRTRR